MFVRNNCICSLFVTVVSHLTLLCNALVTALIDSNNVFVSTYYITCSVEKVTAADDNSGLNDVIRQQFSIGYTPFVLQSWDSVFEAMSHESPK